MLHDREGVIGVGDEKTSDDDEEEEDIEEDDIDVGRRVFEIGGEMQIAYDGVQCICNVWRISDILDLEE